MVARHKSVIFFKANCCNICYFRWEKARKEICFLNVNCVFSTKICLVLNQKIEQKPWVVVTWWLPMIKVGWPDENNRLPRIQGRSKIHWVFFKNFGISHHLKKINMFFHNWALSSGSDSHLEHCIIIYVHTWANNIGHTRVHYELTNVLMHSTIWAHNAGVFYMGSCWQV